MPGRGAACSPGNRCHHGVRNPQNAVRNPSHDLADQESADQESADHELFDHELFDHELFDQESADHESAVHCGAFHGWQSASSSPWIVIVVGCPAHVVVM
jgi:hypothetical protein